MFGVPLRERPARVTEAVTMLKAAFSGEPTGQFRVLTPDQLIAELKAAPVPFPNFHPLVGGMPIDLAWSSLRLFERDVLPALN